MDAPVEPQVQNSAPVPTTQTQQPSTPAPVATGSVPLAGNWGRFWASVTDGLILGVIGGVLLLPLAFISKTGNSQTSKSSLLIVGVIFIVIWLIYRVYLTVAKGATIGKDLYGLKVYQESNDQTITYPKAFLREFSLGILGAIPIVGPIIALVNDLFILMTKRGIHDRLAHTRVVKVNPIWPMKKQLPVFVILIILVIGVYSVLYFVNPTFLNTLK